MNELEPFTQQRLTNLEHALCTLCAALSRKNLIDPHDATRVADILLHHTKKGSTNHP